MRQVIYIYGASGSGTTTLGKYICSRLGYYFMDTDDYFWLPTDTPYSEKRPATERISMMREAIDTHEKVVISGSLDGWGDVLIPLFTLAIRVETDTTTRIERIKIREREKFGSRIEFGGDMHENHQAFLEWAAAYDHGGTNMRSKAKHNEWQKQLLCQLLILDGNAPLEESFNKVVTMLV